MKKKSTLERFYNEKNQVFEIGIDEAGRGPMFGRVYSGAVILPKNNDFQYDLLKDSKKFTSEKKINEVADYIKNNALLWSVSYEDESIIDNINIRNATHSSMHKSIKNIIKQYSESNCNKKSYAENFYLLVDGNDFKNYTYFENNLLHEISHICIEGGDNKYCSIAAASILAKVERDKYIKDLCKNYPQLDNYYNLEKNKGYGTSKHIEAIKNIGISPWHRKTYGCCKNAKLNSAEFYL
tara:strand:+ start:843 stop:1559 length:717 start_codon:yes stop_codon:yes gene_type:complete